MRSDTVSAIITTYKRDLPMLREAVESALNQTWPHMEVIVVSDNPPDSPWAAAVAAGMRDYPAVRFIQLPKNSGAQAARNAGIRAASGDFVAFLDDDDIWLKQKIEKQMPCFDDPEVALSYCRGYEFDNADREHMRDYSNARWGFHTRAKFEELLVRDYIGSTSQAVIRKSCFAKCGYFDENLRARQDYDRWLAITRHYAAVGVDEALFLHRMHAGEQITKSPTVALEANAYVFHKYADAFKKSPAGRMAYYYNRAFVLKGMGKRGAFLRSAARSFFSAPGAFIRKYRSYRKEEA